MKNTIIGLLLTCCFWAATARQAPAQTLSPYPRDARVMIVVPHQDDDLGLVPDTTERGVDTLTVFLTAGDSGFCSQYADERFAGNRRAYATAAARARGLQAADERDERDWQFGIRTLLNGTKRVQTAVLKTTGSDFHTAHVYFWLPNNPFKDDTNDGVNDLANLPPDLSALWNRLSPVITTAQSAPVGGAVTYTLDELINALSELIVEYRPTHLITQDGTFIVPAIPDLLLGHPDHQYTAAITLVAAQRAGAEREHLMVGDYYAAYVEEPNMHPEDTEAILRYFRDYRRSDPKICPTEETDEVSFCQRDGIRCDSLEAYKLFENKAFAIRHVSGVVGGLRRTTSAKGAECLSVSAGAANAQLALSRCAPSQATQRFALQPDGTLRYAGGGAPSNLCVTAQALLEPLRLRPCDGTEHQQFSLNTVGQLRGPLASCVTAQAAGPVASPCQTLFANSNQVDWSLQFRTEVFTASAAGFSDDVIPAADAYARTLKLGAFGSGANATTGICVRRPDGVYCGMYDPSTRSFAEPTRRSTDFADGDGLDWGATMYGSTVQLGQVDGRPGADLCGRGRLGVYCAGWDGNGFSGFSLRTTAFSDAQGYASRPALYASLRLADVTGDGYDDLCALSDTPDRGIVCAINRKDGTFGPTTPFIDAGFTDRFSSAELEAQLGGHRFLLEKNARTLQFGDISGDGFNDVCARSSRGVYCALNVPNPSNPTAGTFRHFKKWSDANDFKDQAGWSSAAHRYGSIRLADIDGDGRADICGRTPTGLQCGLSLGMLFAAHKPVLTVDPYDDASRWNQDRYGASLMFPDLNGDRHADVCARGPYGGTQQLRCAYGP